MTVTGQDTRHATGKACLFKTADLSVSGITRASIKKYVSSMLADSPGLSVFGKSVTNVDLDLIANELNDAHGTDVNPQCLIRKRINTLKNEAQFNQLAGFTGQDDARPALFACGLQEPGEKTARLFTAEVTQPLQKILSSA